jgi:hypothetical protein
MLSGTFYLLSSDALVLSTPWPWNGFGPFFSNSQPCFSSRFAFTLLDPDDPDRRFEFSLAVVGGSEEDEGENRRRNRRRAKNAADDASSYELVSVDEILAGRAPELDGLLRGLNETDDMGAFTLGMRGLFASAVLGE